MRKVLFNIFLTLLSVSLFVLFLSLFLFLVGYRDSRNSVMKVFFSLFKIVIILTIAYVLLVTSF